jgi:O-antigen ligase
MISLSTFQRPLASAFGGLLPARIRHFRPSMVFSACALTLVLSLLLGGGTRGGFLSDAILELFAIPAFLIALSSLIDLPVWKTGTRTDVYWVLAFCCAVALLPLIQLVPLPPWVWTRLPGREEVTKVFDLLGDRAPWMPISVSPHATWLSFLSLLPAMAVFLAAIQLGYAERRRLSLIVVAMGVVSAFLGLTQLAEGPTSSLRFFSFTNSAAAVGFFANRNHYAALLYVVLLFAAAWAVNIAINAGSFSDLRRLSPRTIVSLTASFMVLIVLIVGEAMARSRAGLGLTVVALVGAFTLLFTGRRNGSSGITPSKLLIGVVLLAIVLVVQFALYPILQRFSADPMDSARIPFAHNTFRAALAFMPFGSGLGTFVPVYGVFERPNDVVAFVYANHAHNDILEVWLETGVAGIALAGFFATWLVLKFIKLWRRAPPHAHELDHSLMRAALIAIGLLIAHSFVDYPLRTGAMMAVFAFACALLIEPLADADAAIDSASADRHATPQRNVPKPPVPVLAAPRPEPPAAPAPSKGRWGEDIEWPEAWNKSGVGPKPDDR